MSVLGSGIIVTAVCVIVTTKAEISIVNNTIDCSELSNYVLELQKSVSGLKVMYQKQEIDISNQKHEIIRLNQEVNNLKMKKSGLKDVRSRQNRSRDRHNDNTTTKAQPARRLLIPNTGTSKDAFTAYLDHELSHLGIDQTIIFNRVLFNDGNAFNSRSGIFTCPVNGVYMFFFAVGSGYGGSQHQIVAKLVTNGVNQVDAIADSEYHNCMKHKAAIWLFFV